MDCTCFVMIANALSLMLLWRRCARRLPFRRYFRVAAVFWIMACALGLTLLTWRAWRIDIPERELYHHGQLQNTRAFMATGDIRVFDNKPKSELPLPQGDPTAPPLLHEGELIVKYLDNPWVRKILPACVRDPLKVAPESVTGFVTNGAAQAKPRIPGEVSWGSYTQEGAAAWGRFESFPIPRSRFPFLEFRVAGDLGKPGLSLNLVGLRSGQTTAVIPREMAGGNWRNCRVRAPSGDFKIVASDESITGWFAFQAPREVGWLSWAAVEVASLGGWIFASGLTLYLAGVVLVLRSGRDRDHSCKKQEMMKEG
jgi:hypothetical protein